MGSALGGSIIYRFIAGSSCDMVNRSQAAAVMHVKSIKITNIKGFKDAEFDLSRADGELAGWTVFAGGNASGKSTLLKGLGLALMGPDSGRALMGSPEGWLHRNERKGAVEATITWDKEWDAFRGGGRQPGPEFEAGVRWTKEAADSEITSFKNVEKRVSGTRSRIQTPDRGPWEPAVAGWFSTGYGPMRRLSGSSSDSIRHSAAGGVTGRYVTLFREDAALSESEAWFRLMHARVLEHASRNGAAKLLEGVQALMNDGLLPYGLKISRITVDNVFLVDHRGVELPMRDISDGCRGIYATVLDLIHGMHDVYGGERLFDLTGEHPSVVAPGVVLIDEIEAHLHPSWQREIPFWLTRHFPNIQFLVTTHSPLIAQAARSEGIFVLPSLDDPDQGPRRLSPEECDRIRWGKAEKTLLGAAFGLKTTRSPWASGRIDAYQRLDAKKRAGVPLSKAEERERAEIKERLERYEQMDLFPLQAARGRDAA